MRKGTKLILGIVIIAFIIRVLFIFSAPIRIWDETVYANLGYDISKNFFDYSFANNGWSDFIPSKNIFYSWPKAGFRAPLLPYILSIFYSFRADFLINLLVPFIGSLTVFFVYIFGKKLFNERVGLYSCFFLALLPLHVLYSSKILTGVLCGFFVLLTFISFWKGYEEKNNKYKVLFGLFLALALLSRYTTLWIIPIFLIYFLLRDRSFKFLKDKYLWYSILAFFTVLIPWFIYGYVEYKNPLGAFIHGKMAAPYWAGAEPWYFFFQYWWPMFSIVGIVFFFAVLFVIYKKHVFKKEIYLPLLWVFFFILMDLLMAHKEERFLLPIVPAICLMAGFFVSKFKKYRNWIFLTIIIILLFSLYFSFFSLYQNSHIGRDICFYKGNLFLREVEDNAVIITDESPVIYYYAKKETHFYPNPWSLDNLENLAEVSYAGHPVYIFFTDYDMSLDQEEHIKIKQDLDNFNKVFECSEDNGLSIIYRSQQ